MKNKFRTDEVNDESSKDDSPKDEAEKSKFTSKAVKTIMTEQLISPPSHIWDKIERVLDHQQQHRDAGSEMIISSLKKARSIRKNFLIAAAAGVTVIAGLLWIIL